MGEGDLMTGAEVEGMWSSARKVWSHQKLEEAGRISLHESLQREQGSVHTWSLDF